MSKMVIDGACQLSGEIEVRGAKNAALPLLMAAAASPQKVVLNNVPNELKDIQAEIEALQYIGCHILSNDDRIEIEASQIKETSLPENLTSKFRTSLLFLGLLVGRCGHAKIHMPGGCSLGDRKYDLHLEGLKRLGAKIKVTDSAIEVEAAQLHGADIDFYLPTTTGTVNVMLAACFAKDRTRIFNANTRPEIADVASFLNKLGADISVKNRVVEIQGGRQLGSGEYRVMKGWDEALTYIIAAGMTRGEICIRNFTTEHIKNDTSYLRQAGLDIFEWGGNVYVSAKNRVLRAFDLFTAPYPGVNSDMQPLFAAFASQCKGESSVTDQRFTERFQYVEELKKLGVAIEAYGNCAVVKGPSSLKGANAVALDLRCGAALVLAALASEGRTTIENSYQIHRGYEFMVQRMASLGARISSK